jgi:hypothetical protein
MRFWPVQKQLARVMLAGPGGADREFSDIAENVRGMWLAQAQIHGWDLVKLSGSFPARPSERGRCHRNFTLPKLFQNIPAAVVSQGDKTL